MKFFDFANYTVSRLAKDVTFRTNIFEPISYIESVDNDNIDIPMYINNDWRKAITNL